MSWLGKNNEGTAVAGSLAIREHHCSQCNFCIFLYTWYILCSFLIPFSCCFMQIHVIFTVFKQGKMFQFFCEVVKVDFSNYVISSLLLGTLSWLLSFIHWDFSWTIDRSSLSFHVSYKYLCRTFMQIYNLVLICSWNKYKNKIVMSNERYCSSVNSVYICG